MSVKIKGISTENLMAYSTVLENIMETSRAIVVEANQAIQQRFAVKEDLDDIVQKCLSSMDSNRDIYVTIQKEIDARITRDLGIKMGIRFSQNLIKSFDDRIEELRKKNEEDDKAKGVIPIAQKPE